jgi:PAS domain S-box-containing protein
MTGDMEDLEAYDYKHLYFHIFEKINAAIFLLDREGRIIFCNSFTEIILDCDKEHIIGKNFLDFIKIPLIFYSTTENNFYQVKKRYLNKTYEFSHIKKSGAHLWLSIKMSKINTRNKTVYLVTCKDITNRKILELNTESLVSNFEDLYKLLIYGVNIYHVIDSGRDFIFKNSVLSNDSEYYETKGNLVGRSILELLPPAYKFKIFRKFQEVYNSGKANRVLLELKELDYEERKLVEYNILRLSPYEIITISNDSVDKFDLKKTIGDFKTFYFQIRLNAQKSYKKSYYEKVINSILSQFIRKINIDDAIIASLKYLCDAVKGSRSFLFLFDKKKELMDNTHEWCAEGIFSHKNQFKAIKINRFQWSMKKILKGKHVKINNIKNMPVEAEPLRSILLTNGIESTIFIPIYIENSIGGFIGIDDEEKVRNWDLEDVKLLQICSQIIGNAIERKFIEEKLEYSEKKYRVLFNKSTHLIALMTLGGKIIDVNDTILKVLKKSREDIIGKQFRDVIKIHSKNLEILKLKFKDLLNKGYFDAIELNIETDAFKVRWIKVEAVLLDFNYQKLIQVIIQDITDKKESEKRIIESEEKYKGLFKESPLPIILLEQNGTILDGNPAIEDLFGYNLSNLIGQDLMKLKIIPSSYMPKFLNAYKELKEKGITQSIEIQCYTSNRKLKWIRGQASLINLLQNKVVQIIVQDIDDIKKSKLKIIESEIKYNDVLDTINEGYFEVDRNGNLTSFNKAFYKDLGYSERDLINKHFSILFDTNNKERLESKFYELYKKGEGSVLFDYEISTKDGEKKYHESSIYLRYNSEGEIIGLRGLVRDISERKKIEVLREKFKEKLENEVELRTKELNEALKKQKLYLDQILKASNFKTEFLSTMSHELRTPLNAIIGFTDLLLGDYYGQLNYNQRDFIRDIEESANHLLDMITNILDISKIESGEISLNLELVELNQIVKNVISTFHPLLSKKRLKIKINGLSEKQKIVADKLKLKQVIYNILSNAIKFTEKGSITFEFEDKLNEWEFRIKDTGIGIAEEDYDLIFKDFKRVNTAYVNAIPGSGLGLALSKRLVTLHQGKIYFTSKVGKGTTFTFNIPKNITKDAKNLQVEDFLNLL